MGNPRLELIRYWASAVVSGHLPAIESARRITQVASEDFDHLLVFRGLVANWETASVNRDGCERAILEQASLLLADPA